MYSIRRIYMPRSKTLGNKIKDLRNQFDLTQSDLEHFSGVNINIIKQIETGRSGTSKKKIIAIVNALKVTIEEIYI
jgi:chromosome partitioning protein